MKAKIYTSVKAAQNYSSKLIYIFLYLFILINIQSKNFIVRKNEFTTEERVNDNFYNSDETNPSLAILSDGGFVVVWSSNTQANGYDIYAKIYDSSNGVVKS